MQTKNSIDYTSFVNDENCKNVISTLVSNLDRKKYDLYLSTIHEQNLSKKVVDGEQVHDFPEQRVDGFIEILNRLGIINVFDKKYEYNENCTITKSCLVEIVNLEEIKSISTVFEAGNAYETYGVSKQNRMFEEVLKNKFSTLENAKFIIRHADFVKPHNFLFLTTLFTYERDGYLLIKRISSDNRSYEHQSTAHIELKDKIFKKWSSTYLSPSNYVRFDLNSGILKVENKDYKFSEPDNIESKLMDLMVQNINSRVAHKDIAKITWGYSDSEYLESQYAKNKGEINQKNKVRISDLRKKIKKCGLKSKLQFKPCNGYMLEYHIPDRIDEDIKMIIADSMNKISF